MRARGVVAGLVLGFSGLALAGCSEREGPDVALVAPPPPPPTVSRIGQPAGQQQVLHSNVSERTRVGADGTVHTTRTTTSVSFDPNRAAAAVDSLVSAANRPADGSIPGTWTSRSSSTGTGCTIALYGDPTAQEGSAASACNAGSVLAGVTTWRYSEGRLVLYKGSEEALAMNRAGPHRFDGTAKWGFLSTTITLFR